MLKFSCKGIFTHAPSVPDGDEYRNDHSHESSLLEDNDLEFVEWLNSEAGSKVEAVFAGHTHQDHVFYGVSTSEIYAPVDYYKPIGSYSPSDNLQLSFSDSAYYIETNTACKGY